MYNLMSGYKAKSKKKNINPEELAKDMFWLNMVLGILFLIIPFVAHIPYAPPTIFGIAIFYSIFVVLRANIRYDKRYQNPKK